MRKLFKKLHRWLSLPVGIILSIICITGAMLVFQDEIEEAANPTHYFVNEATATPIPLEQLIIEVNAQLKDNTVNSVKISSDPKRTYTMGLSKGFRISVFVDQYTGKITGRYAFKESPFFTIMSIHRWLLDDSRTWGKYTVGISTLAFAVILVSGFIIWFPRKKKKKNYFKIETKLGRKRLFRDIHSVLGVYACLFLLIGALTGLMWSFDWYKNSVYRLLGAKVPKEKKEQKEQKKESTADISHWQETFNTLQAQNTNYDYIRIQDGSADVHLKSAVNRRANDKYKFDNQTGNITETILYGDQEQSSKIAGWSYTLHVGNYLGIWSKIFTFVAAIIGASLPLTGYYMFFVKKTKKHKKVKSQQNK